MVTATISEIYDLSTAVGRGTVLKVHTPTGNNVKRHLMGHFLQYKQFKYLGAEIALVPASTLPADPLQLGYEEGEPTIDPRDMVNPILYKWYHGEAMLTDGLERKFPDPYGREQDNTMNMYEHLGHSVDEQFYLNGIDNSEYDSIYPNCLMDPSFRKAGVQQGFRTSCKPYVYNMVTDKQYLSNVGVGPSMAFKDKISMMANWQGDNVTVDEQLRPESASGDGASVRASQLNKQFVGNIFTNKLVPLGWMDTVTNTWTVDASNLPDQIADDRTPLDASPTGNLNPYPPNNGSPIVGNTGSFSMQTYLPNIPMLYVMMPPAYKTLFYFRLVIKHHFAFRKFRSCYNIQSFATAAVSVPMPVPYVTTGGQTLSLISKMIEETAEGGPDSVTVENGEIMSSADGVVG